jgi:hypothetical protein
MSSKKAERREKIAGAVEARKKPGLRCTVWLTRDLAAGALSPDVDVWVRQPRQLRFPDHLDGTRTVRWYADPIDSGPGDVVHVALWSRGPVERAALEYRTGPRRPPPVRARRGPGRGVPAILITC